jgi:hypothetical protein
MKFSDGLAWTKSSRSGDNQGNCVYVATTPDVAGLRDSKDGADGPRLWVSSSEFAALLDAVKANELDL